MAIDIGKNLKDLVTTVIVFALIGGIAHACGFLKELLGGIATALVALLIFSALRKIL